MNVSPIQIMQLGLGIHICRAVQKWTFRQFRSGSSPEPENFNRKKTSKIKNINALAEPDPIGNGKFKQQKLQKFTSSKNMLFYIKTLKKWKLWFFIILNVQKLGRLRKNHRIQILHTTGTVQWTCICVICHSIVTIFCTHGFILPQSPIKHTPPPSRRGGGGGWQG